MSWHVPGYAHRRELGDGISGRVVLAVSEDSGAMVVIKYLKVNPEDLDRVREDVALISTLDSPYIARIREYVEDVDGRHAAIVMDAINGVSLRHMLRDHGALAPEAALLVFRDALFGLVAAHDIDLIHGDFRPENVLVDAGGSALIIDLGIDAWISREITLRTGVYFAPERWRHSVYTTSVDVYALTVTFIEMYVGEPPYWDTVELIELRAMHEQGEIPLELFPFAFRDVVRLGLAKTAEARADAVTLLELIEVAAVAEFGEDWDIRGRRLLGERIALLALPFGDGVVDEEYVESRTELVELDDYYTDAAGAGAIGYAEGSAGGSADLAAESADLTAGSAGMVAGSADVVAAAEDIAVLARIEEATAAEAMARAAVEEELTVEEELAVAEVEKIVVTETVLTETIEVEEVSSAEQVIATDMVVAEGTVAEGTVAEGTVAEGMVSGGMVSEGIAVESIVAESEVVEDVVVDEVVAGEIVGAEVIGVQSLGESVVAAEAVDEDVVIERSDKGVAASAIGIGVVAAGGILIGAEAFGAEAAGVEVLGAEAAGIASAGVEVVGAEAVGVEIVGAEAAGFAGAGGAGAAIAGESGVEEELLVAGAVAVGGEGIAAGALANVGAGNAETQVLDVGAIAAAGALAGAGGEIATTEFPRPVLAGVGAGAAAGAAAGGGGGGGGVIGAGATGGGSHRGPEEGSFLRRHPWTSALIGIILILICGGGALMITGKPAGGPTPVANGSSGPAQVGGLTGSPAAGGQTGPATPTVPASLAVPVSRTSPVTPVAETSGGTSTVTEAPSATPTPGTTPTPGATGTPPAPAPVPTLPVTGIHPIRQMIAVAWMLSATGAWLMFVFRRRRSADA